MHGPGAAAPQGSSVRHDDTSSAAACIPPLDDRRCARDRSPDRDDAQCWRANRGHRQRRSGHAIRRRPARQAHSDQHSKDANAERSDRRTDQREIENPVAEAFHDRRHRQGCRHCLRQHGAANAGDAERLHRESREAGLEDRNPQVPDQGRSDLEPDHPRPLPEQLPVQRQGRRRRLATKNRDDANVVGYDYTLRPILFVVPRGSPPAAFEARAQGSRGAARPISEIARRASRWPEASALSRCVRRWSKARPNCRRRSATCWPRPSLAG